MSGDGKGDRILGGASTYRAGTEKWIENGIQYERTLFKNTRVKPGVLHIPTDVRRWAEQQGIEKCVLINPHVKKSAGRSKDWGWERWLELASRSKHRLVQCDYGKGLVPGVDAIETPTFEHGAALIGASLGVVTTEGGMHHAAGALRKPAVVIFGGTNPPQVMGYEFHQNLAVDYPDALGRRGEHPSCRAAMAMITVEQVLAAMKEAFGG